MALNLHLLRVFFEVVQQQSYSGAARALFISQPAVSKAVRELEHQLGLELVERAGSSARSGIRLTDNGTALFKHARGIFALERAAVEDIRDRVELKQGRLVVGASFTIASYWLPPYAARFALDYPSADLHIRAGNTHAVSTALIDCDIDIGLVEGTIDDGRLVATRWKDDELCIVASTASALSKKRSVGTEDLDAQTWLLREPGSGTREIGERLMREHGIRPGRLIEFGSNEGIARAVAEGAGLAMLPTITAQELVGLGKLAALRFEAGRLVRPLYLVRLRDRILSPLAGAFYRMLDSCGPDTPE